VDAGINGVALPGGFALGLVSQRQGCVASPLGGEEAQIVVGATNVV
jgi:hypothetical protein